MTDNSAPTKFGPLSFVAALVTSLIFEFAAVTMGYFVIFLLYFVLPALLVAASIGGLLYFSGGKATQVGLGVLIGCLAAPLTAAIAIIVLVVT
ncbi:hypothetical protein A5792_15930 [Mycolicibacterium peregrinum]|uniref:Uncharacterized protein n=1 Tax=Mycolicibacterium peregrinum TaxID=43304 RepID=A0A1A0R9Z9_MYCPR|nr:hypothetical protein [Mycolicibacterium peregrinum]OBB31320.1 hypothetical protein A5792_15930 [Mycolicibacterium peregrinum]